jgi:four helix bundle protein
MRDFRRLQVWQKSHRLVFDVYQATKEFPDAELFGMVSQMRRAAVSVPANSAEGCGRETERDFRRFLHVAAGSANELEYHLILSKDLGYLSVDAHSRFDEQVNEIQRMLSGLIRSINLPK